VGFIPYCNVRNGAIVYPIIAGAEAMINLPSQINIAYSSASKKQSAYAPAG
jgi:hypothetical protein